MRRLSYLIVLLCAVVGTLAAQDNNKWTITAADERFSIEDMQPQVDAFMNSETNATALDILNSPFRQFQASLMRLDSPGKYLLGFSVGMSGQWTIDHVYAKAGKSSPVELPITGQQLADAVPTFTIVNCRLDNQAQKMMADSSQPITIRVVYGVPDWGMSGMYAQFELPTEYLKRIHTLLIAKAIYLSSGKRAN